ncbi:MAG TPA: DUF488 domain-containing protein [Chloroflexia bacterium]|nr:DUF488 domain-containing protein [Chloroflexia bacterium]
MLQFDHACCTLPATWPSAQASALVLAMRRPRGTWLKAVRDAGGVWVKEAGPSAALLTAYREGTVSWEVLAARYCAEMREDRPEVLDQLVALATAHPAGRLTVMCWERLDSKNPHCHRTLLVDLLREHVGRLGQT